MKRYFIPVLALAVLMLGRVPAGVSQKQLYNDADSRELLAFRLTDDLWSGTTARRWRLSNGARRTRTRRIR